MLLPARYQGPLGHSDSGFNHADLEYTISDWRDGKEPGKPLCLFNRLVNGEDVPAKKVAAYARAVAAKIHETSRFAHERPKLEQVAAYADAVAPYEEFAAQIKKAVAVAKKANMRYRDIYEDFVRIASEAKLN